MLSSGEGLWNIVKDFLNSPEETRRVMRNSP
jgi:hypothetical protein